jgi:hypothetical protein
MPAQHPRSPQPPTSPATSQASLGVMTTSIASRSETHWAVQTGPRIPGPLDISRLIHPPPLFYSPASRDSFDTQFPVVHSRSHGFEYSAYAQRDYFSQPSLSHGGSPIEHAATRISNFSPSQRLHSSPPSSVHRHPRHESREWMRPTSPSSYHSSPRPLSSSTRRPSSASQYEPKGYHRQSKEATSSPVCEITGDRYVGRDVELSQKPETKAFQPRGEI